MDAKQDRLRKKLDELLTQVTAVATELHGVDEGNATPHFDQIELPAQAVGRELSRMIQNQRAREVAARQPAKAARNHC